MQDILDKEKCKSGFLVPFFGPLPSYFPFWAKSCEVNHQNFHWYVYNDAIERKINFNEAVTLIPYSFAEMIKDFRSYLGIDISSGHVRRVCDYRLMYYFIRQEREDFSEYDFIGYTDIDMIYGKIVEFIPDNISDYSMISANDGKPCGPFTLIKKSSMHLLADSDFVRRSMESYDHKCFDESVELVRIIAGENSTFCSCDPIQPALMAGFNYRKTFSIWNNGVLRVFDSRWHEKEGGFHHFSRYKNRQRFKVEENVLQNQHWGCCKYGIIPIRSRWTTLFLRFSLLV